MSFELAIFFFLDAQRSKGVDSWFSVRQVSCAVGLSVNRTRRHLSLLVFKGELETRMDGWRNVYRAKR